MRSITTPLVIAVVTSAFACAGGDEGPLAPAPPPEPPTGSLVTECAAPEPEWIWCDDFEDNRLASYFEVHNGGGRFSRTAGVGIGGSQAMRARFDPGTVEAGNLKIAFGLTPDPYIRPVDAGTTKHRDIYWRVFVYYPHGWQGGVGHKMSRATALAGSNWAQAMIAHVWGGDDYLYLDPASGTDPAGTLRTTTYNDFPNLRWLGARRSASRVSTQTGNWQCIESRARLNDPGASNGIQQLWIDGVLQAERTDLNWLGAYSAYGINAVFLENYWNDGAPARQDRFYDNVIVSTAPIGCGDGVP